MRHSDRARAKKRDEVSESKCETQNKRENKTLDLLYQKDEQNALRTRPTQPVLLSKFIVCTKQTGEIEKRKKPQIITHF